MKGNSMTSNAIMTREQMAIEDVKTLANIVLSLRDGVFKLGLDYGIIPGTGSKPTLLLPGMEKLLRALHLRPEYVEKSRIEDFDNNLIYYRYECRLIDYDTGLCLSTAIGSANSHESKWRWREQSRACPVCGKETIIKGKEEYGGGWLCFAKKGGCGAKFKDGDAAIEGQAVGRIENPDIFDQMNTIDKIAQKRALGSAIKGAANVSEFFTVDLEDFQQFDTSRLAPQSNVIEGSFEEVSTDKPSSTVRGAGPTKHEPPSSWADNSAKWDEFLASALDKFKFTSITVEEILGVFDGLGFADWRQSRGWALAALIADYCENDVTRIDEYTSLMAANGTDEKAALELSQKSRQIATAADVAAQL